MKLVLAKAGNGNPQGGEQDVVSIFRFSTPFSAKEAL